LISKTRGKIVTNTKKVSIFSANILGDSDSGVGQLVKNPANATWQGFHMRICGSIKAEKNEMARTHAK
jgi:hypothetical protein